MTTATTNAPADHTTDAGYRAWIIDFHLLISTAGLVQTADTGQINTASVTRPAANNVNGYSIWRMPDSSLYFKFQFGTGAGATNQPRIQLQVGEGSNGSGTLTGALSTNQNMEMNSSSNGGVYYPTLPYTSYCCVTNDFFGVVWKVMSGENVYCQAHFMVFKTTDNTGTANNIGYMVIKNSYFQSGAADNVVYQCVRRASPATTFATSYSNCLIPGVTASLPSNSLDSNGACQAWTIFGAFPDVIPVIGACVIKTQDVLPFTTFQCALIGVTPRTYLNVGRGTTFAEARLTNSNFILAMLWE